MSASGRRVLIVGPTPPPYHGVATFIRDLLAASPCPSGFQFEHLDTSDRRDASNIGRWDAGNLALGFSNLAALAQRLALRRHDLVYIPMSQNVPAFLRDALFIFQARLFGARVLLHLHGGYFRAFYEKDAPGWFRAIARCALNRAAVIAVLSAEFRPIFSGLVPEARVCVVENGVPDLFSQPTSGVVPHARPTILYMSTLTRSKGILDLIRAVALLRTQIPDVLLRAAGNWSDDASRAESLALIEREHLSGCVEFTGNVDGAAKREFLTGGDLFCLPTHYPYEGQPLAILEAMSAALPVLSTRHGAIGSTVLHGITGQLLEPNCEPKTLAEALHDMFTDREKLSGQGQAGRRRYLERYTLEHCHARLIQAFELAMK